MSLNQPPRPDPVSLTPFLFLRSRVAKGRGICPSCNQRAMVETAAHLIDSVLPQVPFRQFVMSFPKRIRCYVENHKTLQTVLKIVVDEIRKTLINWAWGPRPIVGLHPR